MLSSLLHFTGFHFTASFSPIFFSAISLFRFVFPINSAFKVYMSILYIHYTPYIFFIWLCCVFLFRFLFWCSLLLVIRCSHCFSHFFFDLVQFYFILFNVFFSFHFFSFFFFLLSFFFYQSESGWFAAWTNHWMLTIKSTVSLFSAFEFDHKVRFGLSLYYYKENLRRMHKFDF